MQLEAPVVCLILMMQIQKTWLSGLPSFCGGDHFRCLFICECNEPGNPLPLPPNCTFFGALWHLKLRASPGVWPAKYVRHAHSAKHAVLMLPTKGATRQSLAHFACQPQTDLVTSLLQPGKGWQTPTLRARQETLMGCPRAQHCACSSSRPAVTSSCKSLGVLKMQDQPVACL